MATATTFQTGINMLQVGCLRMPCLFAQMNTALLVGELAFRIIKTGLEYCGFTGESALAKKVSSWTPNGTQDILRPYGNKDLKTIVIGALICGVVGNIGTTVVATAFGPAPAIYNRVLSLLGNIRIVDDLHPALRYAASFVR